MMQTAVMKSTCTWLTDTHQRSQQWRFESVTLRLRWSLTLMPPPTLWMKSHSNRSTAATTLFSNHCPNAFLRMDQLTTARRFNGLISYHDNQCVVTLHVFKGNHGSLLSYKTATTFGILDIHIRQVREHISPKDKLCSKYPSLFRGTGKLKNEQVKLHIDPTIKPVVQQARRIPYQVRQKVAEELCEREQKGIIERMYGPTRWVSPLVIIPKKNGKVRVCVDVRMANRAIIRERHPMPTVDDLILTLNGATVFSKLNLWAGYHQLSLSPECRYITTFATHKGLWRCPSASERAHNETHPVPLVQSTQEVISED